MAWVTGLTNGCFDAFLACFEAFLTSYLPLVSDSIDVDAIKIGRFETGG